MIKCGQDSFNIKTNIVVEGKSYTFFNIQSFLKNRYDINKIPYSLKILLENLLRHEDGKIVNKALIESFINCIANNNQNCEIFYRPARVLMQDFTGVPAIVDLAAMREAVINMGGDPKSINPLTPVDLVIDHSVMVDQYGNDNAFKFNVAKEYERNKERYTFLRWGQSAFNNFRVVPPGTGICHQVNLEHLAQCVWTTNVDGIDYVYPDTLVGTDSHTTMINALGVLGWGVGGIEAESSMLGQPISMLLPKVVGVKLTGTLQEGTTATDLVLTITNILRKHGVVGKFVEFFGDGMSSLSLADRSTISNMAPEYGATCGIFPIDAQTLDYLQFTGRKQHTISLIEQYTKAQGMWHDQDSVDPEFSEVIQIELSQIQPSLAGPKRPQDKVLLSEVPQSVNDNIDDAQTVKKSPMLLNGENIALQDGDIVIAAITSCTNTSNPNVMIGAGLLAKKALEKGLSIKSWVKTSLAPGSKVVTDYLAKSGLQVSLDKLGFNVVGYGCTTCIGNSGPLLPEISNAIDENDLSVGAVLSGNRNFEGRVHQQVKLNYLASPILVVAYAIAGNLRINFAQDILGHDSNNNPVYLKDIWPSNDEISEYIKKSLTSEMFITRYKDVFSGDDSWQALPNKQSLTYPWDQNSSYVRKPSFFEGAETQNNASDVKQARILALLGNSITTDHISPAGSIKEDSAAGIYLRNIGINKESFNSFGARRGNHEVMMRGTFGNIRLNNEMVTDKTGGYTKIIPDDVEASIYDAAMTYKARNIPLVIIAGKEYGTGSSRDWAAKGTKLLGIKAVIAESFERIHRSNLIGMGVLPCEFTNGDTKDNLDISGNETIDICGISSDLTVNKLLDLSIIYPDGKIKQIKIKLRLDTLNEIEYYKSGGILNHVLTQIVDKK